MLTEYVFTGRDNTIDLLLEANGEVVNMASVTRMTLDVGGTVIDSDTSPSAFDWDNGTIGKLVLSLGGEGLSAGTYRCALTVYDSDNPNGVQWPRLKIVVE